MDTVPKEDKKRKERDRMRFLKRHSILAGAILLLLAVILTMVLTGRSKAEPEPFLSESSSSPVSVASSSAVSSSPAATFSGETVSPQEEMRAVWVPFMSLDMMEEEQGEEAFRKKYASIVQKAKQYGMNALVVHVRPFGDALYPSEFAPWSHLLTGMQGKDPGYDPLAIMVELTHAEGLEFHAWMNPLRIQVNHTPEVLSEDNPWNTWQGDEEKAGWVVEYGDGKYYNPAYPEVRSQIAACAEEIASSYDVDGIQFDDYFYPTQDAAFDAAAYEAYTESTSQSGEPLSLQEWRAANINSLLAEVYRRIKSAREEVQFGVSPQGNIQNDWNIGADVAAWCSAKGYLDYICPQLYVNFENPVLPFGTAAQTWKNLVTDPDIELYFGLAVYKAGSDADDGTWKNAGDILARQVSLGRTVECDGFFFYSIDYLSAEQTQEEIANVMKVLEQEPVS